MVLDFIAAALGLIGASSLFIGVGRRLQIAAGILTLLGALVAAFRNSLGPQATADAHREALNAFENLRSRYRSFVVVETDPEKARVDLAAIEEDHAKVKTNSPPVEPWTQEITKRMRDKN
jgi:hypothetical protein